MSGIAKSQVGRLCEEIDENVKAFRDSHWKSTGPIGGSAQPMGRREKNNRIVSVEAIIAIGVDADARRREVLALGIGPSEALTFWTNFSAPAPVPRPSRGQARRLLPPRRHQSRGRQGDDRKLNAAASTSVHFMRNALAHAGKRGGAPSRLSLPPLSPETPP